MSFEGRCKLRRGEAMGLLLTWRPPRRPRRAWRVAFCWMSLLATPQNSLEARPSAPVGSLKTVTVSVVDDRTGQPVSDFGYHP
jgi:hypothetical protein